MEIPILHLQSSLDSLSHLVLPYTLPTVRQVLIYGPLLWLVFCTLVVIRRIWFHPLSHVPGPKLAAATYLYHAYYQVWRGGEFYKHRPALHAKYGLPPRSLLSCLPAPNTNRPGNPYLPPRRGDLGARALPHRLQAENTVHERSRALPHTRHYPQCRNHNRSCCPPYPSCVTKPDVV